MQAVHTTDVELVATVPYAPAPQAVQTEVPEASELYVPKEQPVQTLDAVAPITELYDPAVQPVHPAELVPPSSLL